jgi:uncharacterized protein with HEPN domain
MPHDAAASMLDMAVAAKRAIEWLGDVSEAKFQSDERLQWLMFSQIVLIGEAANRIGRPVQADFPDVPWSDAISMRHRIVHGYESIDWAAVHRTVCVNLPALLAALEPHLPPEEE